MIKTINFSDDALNKVQEWVYPNESYEATAHPYEINGEKKVIKLFKPETNTEKKFEKMEAIKNRTKDIDFVVTADFFIKNNGKLIGYCMPYVKGKQLNTAAGYKKQINELKQLSEELKKLHDLNIVVADFSHNHLIEDSGKIKLIDHDNFAIDDLDIDTKNTYIQNYIKKTNSFDKRFDDYFLNLYTISMITKKHMLYLMQNGTRNLSYCPKDEEILKILINTLDLKKDYNEDLILDKINDKKDLKKLRKRLF